MCLYFFITEHLRLLNKSSRFRLKNLKIYLIIFLFYLYARLKFMDPFTTKTFQISPCRKRIILNLLLFIFFYMELQLCFLPRDSFAFVHRYQYYAMILLHVLSPDNNGTLHCLSRADMRPCIQKGWTNLLYTMKAKRLFKSVIAFEVV